MPDVTKLNTEKQAVKELGEPGTWAMYQERRLVRAKRVNGSFEVAGERTDEGFLVLDPEGQQYGVCVSEFQRRFRPAEDADMRTLTDQPIELAERHAEPMGTRTNQERRGADGDGDGSRG